MTLLILIVGACSMCLLGGVAIGLYLGGVIEWTSRPEDELARRDRVVVR